MFAFGGDQAAFMRVNPLDLLRTRRYWGSAAADAKGSRNYAGVKSDAVDALASKVTGAETREELVWVVINLNMSFESRSELCRG